MGLIFCKTFRGLEGDRAMEKCAQWSKALGNPYGFIDTMVIVGLTGAA